MYGLGVIASVATLNFCQILMRYHTKIANKSQFVKSIMIISFALLLLVTIQISNQEPSREISPLDAHEDTPKDDGIDYIAYPPSDSEIDYIAEMSLAGGQGGLQPTRNLGFQLTLL